MKTQFQVGDLVMLRTKDLLDAAKVGKLHSGRAPFPWQPSLALIRIR